MLAFILAVAVDGTMFTYQDTFVPVEGGGGKFIKGPPVPCDLIRARIIGRHDGQYFDMDVTFK